MGALWAKGDPDGLAVAMNESLAATPELAKTLLWDRNARWADKLKARMDQPGTVFVAVGAGHLAGQRSVQDYLERSEERRVGKECVRTWRYRGSPDDYKKKTK